MNTVADKLMKLVQTKSDIRQALLDKGFNVPDTMPFSGYADLIRRFPCNAKDFPDIPGMIARWSAKGLTNEDMSTNPVWKDLMGNGYDLQMKNFGWAGMSGVNGYVENFNQWFVGFDESNKTVSDSSMKLVLLESDSQKVIYDKTAHQIGYTYNFYIKVTGIEGRTLNVKSGTLGNIIMSITEDGIYSINTTISDDWGNNMLYLIFPPSSSSNTVTIEQLPIYPGFILGDGVDDSAVTEKELNFEDTYTVYTAFIPFQDDPARNMILCGKNDTKDFAINYSGTHLNFKPSTGVNLAVRIDQFALLVCKRNKDITTIINLSTGESRSLKSVEFISNPGLYYLWRSVFATFHAKAAIAGQTICNGYFSTDEDDEKVLDWYKKQYPWLFPGQAWTVVGKTNEDTDKTTIANITGNGNNLVLSNFGFAEGSGYNEEGEYAGYLVTDGVDDSGRAVNVTTEKDFTLVGEWKLFSDTSNNAGLSIHPQIHIFNRPESIQIMFRSAGKTLPVKSLKAICSDGRCYDKDWNELHINVGNFTNNTGTLFVGSNGGNYTKTAFKNLSLYNNQIFSKEDCIKAYNYLQTLKS